MITEIKQVLGRSYKFTLLLGVMILLVSCGTIKYNPKKPVYQFCGYKPMIALIDKKVNVIEDTKEKAVVKASDDLHIGISIIVATGLLSLLFSNKIVHSLASFGFGIGGYFVISALLTLFIAEFLYFAMIITIIAMFLGLLVYFRGRSILETFKSLKAYLIKGKF